MSQNNLIPQIHIKTLVCLSLEIVILYEELIEIKEELKKALKMIHN